MSSSDEYAERRREILGKLRWSEKFYFRKLPRREEAVFREDRNHNPLILEECPRCKGGGRASRYDESTLEGERIQVLTACPECCGLGTTGNVIRYFSDDPPSVDATLGPDGRVRCPSCDRPFSTRDETRWTGMRHATCGQRINLISPPTVAMEVSAEHDEIDDPV